MKKSGIQTHRVAAVRVKAVAGSSGLALSLGWVCSGVGAGKGGGPSRGDCETGRVSVSLRGSSGGGSSGMGLSGRQSGKGMGVSVGPQEAALPPSPQTGSWGPLPHPQTWEHQALSAPAGDFESVLGGGGVTTDARKGERVRSKGRRSKMGKGIIGLSGGHQVSWGRERSEGQWVWDKLGLLEGQWVGLQGWRPGVRCERPRRV